MSTVRYLAYEKKDPRTTDHIAELFARAAYESSGYEVLHKTPEGAAIQPGMVGISSKDLAFMKVTFELVDTE